jgi:hypothetical protein
MTRPVFEVLVVALAVAFAVAFCAIVVPPLIENGDILGAFAAGFVNPYASGYSLDTILCGLILIVWVLYERTALGIRHGWIAIPLAFAPGVATAFGFYLLVRSRQLAERTMKA